VSSVVGSCAPVNNIPDYCEMSPGINPTADICVFHNTTTIKAVDTG